MTYTNQWLSCLSLSTAVCSWPQTCFSEDEAVHRKTRDPLPLLLCTYPAVLIVTMHDPAGGSKTNANCIVVLTFNGVLLLAGRIYRMHQRTLCPFVPPPPPEINQPCSTGMPYRQALLAYLRASCSCSTLPPLKKLSRCKKSRATQPPKRVPAPPPLPSQGNPAHANDSTPFINLTLKHYCQH